jgi:DNA-binding MarR family transcriptional regulator
MPGGRRAPNADNRGRGRIVGALICVFALVMLICMPTPGRAAPTAAVAPAHASPDPLGLEIADVVSRLRRAMRRAARAAGRDGKLPGGLSVAQLELLSCLADSPGARPSQLARLLRLAPSSVATLVQGLRRAGLVSRTGGQRDRRTASLLLTPDGAAIVSSWQEVNEQILQAAITSLGPASRDALDAALPGLRELTGAVDALADDLSGGLGPPADDGRAATSG